MALHLKEFEALVDKKDDWNPNRGIPEPPDEIEITRCIQVLMARQCIYPNMHGLGPTHRTLSTPEYQEFFRRYFAAMGYEFYHDTRSNMVALRVPADVPRYDHQAGRLKKDETSVLLALRIAYEEAYNAKQLTDYGTAETTTNDIFDKLQVVADITLEQPRLDDILALFRKKGVIGMGERDPVEKVTPITILPGIDVVVPATYIKGVFTFAEGLPTIKKDSAVASEAPPSAEDPEAQ